MITPFEPAFHLANAALDADVLALWRTVEAGGGTGRIREALWSRHGELVPLLVKARCLAAACAAESRRYASGKELIAAQSAGETGNFSRPDGRNQEVREGRRQEALFKDPQHWGQVQGYEYYSLRAAQCEALAEGIAAELRRIEKEL